MRADREYFDILQNIEAMVIRCYDASPELTDSDIKKIYKRLLNYYQLQRRAGAGRKPKMSGEKGRLFDAVYEICQWRMGNGVPDGAEPMEAGEGVDFEAIICCLKHLIDSVKTWPGERGYLNYVRQFLKNAERQDR